MNLNIVKQRSGRASSTRKWLFTYSCIRRYNHAGFYQLFYHPLFAKNFQLETLVRGEPTDNSPFRQHE